MTCEEFNAISARDPDISATELVASQDHFENCPICFGVAEKAWQECIDRGDMDAIRAGYEMAGILQPALESMRDDPEVNGGDVHAVGWTRPHA